MAASSCYTDLYVAGPPHVRLHVRGCQHLTLRLPGITLYHTPFPYHKEAQESPAFTTLNRTDGFDDPTFGSPLTTLNNAQNRESRSWLEATVAWFPWNAPNLPEGYL